MLDLRFIREHPNLVAQNARNKRHEIALDRILELDVRRRQLITETDALKHERNRASEHIAQLKKAGQDATSAIAEMRSISERIKANDELLRTIEAELEELLLWIPNIAHQSVPVGEDASANVVVRSVGEPIPAEWRKGHLEIGTALGILDFERGAKVTGSGFAFYVGLGAKLERAMINLFLDVHTQQHGYKEIMPPFLTNRASMVGTGQLPKLADDMYHCPTDDLFLIPTAEVPLTNYFRGEILRERDLPIKLCGYSPCFRREAGSYGRDTRGFLRVHQFNKVELVKFTTPETSYDELERLVADVEVVLRLLELPYRVVLLCTGDMSFASAKTYDLEVWSPVEQRYLEVSSCSNFEAFQARRAQIRYRRTDGQLDYVHTLNGSGLATSRIMVALLEHHQTADGRVRIPDALRPYVGCDYISS
ncbi:MAG: serine--tRNA ligase [Bacteroidota bacterium]|nr:serine--tRNA ligase [Candidatus Kapabacteria bacterium]MDW8075167.1 serine--tRNA ligase [Bacteroidota bacterium]